MAAINIESEFLTNLGGTRIRVGASIRLTTSSTEQRLEIPIHIWIKLMERDGNRDATHLLADWASFEPGDHDDETTGWIYLGAFSGSRTIDVNREIDIGGLVESGEEEIYIVAAARPDIAAAITFSREFWRSDRPGSFLPVVET